MDKIEMNGWFQVTEKVWHGAVFTDMMFPTSEPERAWIKVKKTSRLNHFQGFNIQCNSSFGRESSRASTIEEALEEVKFFMNRRPQDVPEANRKQRLFAFSSNQEETLVQVGETVIGEKVQ